MAEVAVMIPTTILRERALEWNIRQLLMHIDDPFALYIYNDMTNPLKPLVQRWVTESYRSDVNVYVLNDQREISNNRVGCGGARHYLLEFTKHSGHSIVISLDDDVQITPGWYAQMRTAIQLHPQHSVFTSVVKSKSGKVLEAGSDMQIDDIWLTRRPIRTVVGTYQTAPWGPMGNLLFCREALAAGVSLPRDLFIDEDTIMFLLLRELGINETVCVNGATVIEKPVRAPRVPGFRTKETIQAGARYIWHRFGVNTIGNAAAIKRLGIPEDEESRRKFVE